MKKMREKFLEYGTFALVFLLPVLFWGNRIFPHITSKTFFFYGLVEIIFALWLYTIFTDKSYRLNRNNLLFFIPLGAFLLWMTIAGLNAANPELAFWSSLVRGTGLLTLYHASALSLVIASLVARRGFLSYGRRLLMWFLGGSFLLAISVWLGDEGFDLQLNFLKDSRGGGLLGNSSLAAAYLIFGLFFGIFLLFSKETGRRAKIFISIALLSIIFSPLFINLFGGDILGSARGATAGIISGLLAAGIGCLFLSKKKIIRRAGIAGMVISLVIFSLLWVKLITPGTYIHQKFTEAASGTRFIFWDIADKAMKEKPILGWGPENYTIAAQKYFNPKILLSENGAEVWNDKAHNVFYDTGVAGGYPAIAFYAIFLASIFFGIYRAFKSDKLSRAEASIIWGLLAAYLFQNLFVFDSPLSYLGLFIIAGLIYGLNANPSEYLGKQKEVGPQRSPRGPTSGIKDLNYWAGVGLLVLFVPAWIFFAWMPARKSAAFASVFKMPFNLKADHYAELLSGSSVGNHWDVGGLAHDTYVFYLKNRADIKKDEKKREVAEKDLRKFLEYLEEIFKKNPADYRLSLSMARLYYTYLFITEKIKDPIILERAMELARHAEALAPSDPQVYWTKAQILIFSGNESEAEAALRYAIDLDPSILSSHQVMINFAKGTGNQILYDEALEQARKSIPGFSFN